MPSFPARRLAESGAEGFAVDALRSPDATGGGSGRETSARKSGRTVAVSGVVQGVGFRPFVHELACRLGLAGSVKNAGGRVSIELEGEQEALDRFSAELLATCPPLAHIEAVEWHERPPLGLSGFRIEPSEAADTGANLLPPDTATCDGCLSELFDPADRRYRYPFLNCTHCGPRLTIIRSAPYDRERTTMAGFPMCAGCRAEYEDPSDRRFHAQPTACRACGPRLILHGAGGVRIDSPDPVGHVARSLAAGEIVALKALGGYHLACDARLETAVARLRARKRRPAKPFAVMVRDLEAARRLCALSLTEERVLASPRRPIVLARRRADAPVSRLVAPENPFLGLMLPCTPLQHLLLVDSEAQALVMTSGNRSDEPVVIDDEDALRRLEGLAELFCGNDRPIERRADDSVVRVIGEEVLPLRRARGYAPEPVLLTAGCRVPILAAGAQLKSAVALANDRNAFLSPHIGDLGGLAAWEAYVETVAGAERLHSIAPAAVAHDLHPDYASTRYALERAEREGLRSFAVQHHHAHVASCLEENQASGPVIGVAFDGTGLGLDGAVWGGEFLVGDRAGFVRAAHLRYVPLPGGEAAIREPWRMAAVHLTDASEPLDGVERRIGPRKVAAVLGAARRRLNSPLTSSAGRLFDAAASIAAAADVTSFEGEAAMRLEWLAAGMPPETSYPFAVEGASPAVVDTRPIVRALAADVRRGVPAAILARRFHSTVVELIAAVCLELRGAGAPPRVALSGGVFQNGILASECGARLERDGFRVYRHRLVPPNDGGLCLGQLAVAAAALAAGGR